MRTETSAGADPSLISADQSVPCRSAPWRSEGDDEVIIRRGSVPDTCKLNTHHGPVALPWALGISPHPVLILHRLHVPMRQILRTSALSLLLSHLAPSLQLLPPNTRRANPHKPIFVICYHLESRLTGLALTAASSPEELSSSSDSSDCRSSTMERRGPGNGAQSDSAPTLLKIHQRFCAMSPLFAFCTNTLLRDIIFRLQN